MAKAKKMYLLNVTNHKKHTTMKKELKIHIINHILQNDKDFQLMNNTVNKFHSYIYDTGKTKKHKCWATLEAKELFYGHCLACGEVIK